jgi:hypothetical protein
MFVCYLLIEELTVTVTKLATDQVVVGVSELFKLRRVTALW